MARPVFSRRDTRKQCGQCGGSGRGSGSGAGPQGPEGPQGETGATGPEGPPGPTTPNEEETVSTVSGETITAISVAMSANEVLTAGVRWLGWDAANNITIHETTFVLKRTGGGAASEIGAHDNGDIRDIAEAGIVGTNTDYVPTATGVDLTVTGDVGNPMTWTVQIWFDHFLI